MGYRPYGAGLSIDELRRRAHSLALDPDLPSPSIGDQAGPDHRPFILVIDEPEVNGWVIAWPPGSDTGWHDHDGSRAIIIGLHATVTEERPVYGSAHPQSQTCAAGDVVELAPEVLHRMHNLNGGVAALTLHLYSPPLRRQGVYRLIDGLPMQRFAIDGGEELRPIIEPP